MDKVTMSKEDFLREHKRLIQRLLKGDPKELAEEAKSQQEELNKMDNMEHEGMDKEELDGGSKIEILSKIVAELCHLADIPAAKVTIEAEESPEEEKSESPEEESSEEEGSPESLFKKLLKSKREESSY
jgi:hypothetical protein